MGERLERCPECEGVGWMTYGSHSIDSEPCHTCGGRGRLPAPDDQETEGDHG